MWKEEGGKEGRKGTYRHDHHGVGDEELAVPVQDEAAVEVAAYLDGRDAGDDGLRGAFDQLAGTDGVRAAEPFLVVLGDVDGAGEGFGPFEMSGVEVRVRDYDGGEAAFGVDLAGASC